MAFLDFILLKMGSHSGANAGQHQIRDRLIISLANYQLHCQAFIPFSASFFFFGPLANKIHLFKNVELWLGHNNLIGSSDQS